MNQALPPAFRDRPVTALILALFGVGFAMTAFAPALLEHFKLAKAWPSEAPMSALIYPYATVPTTQGFISMLFAGWWFYWVGGEIEGRLGSRRFLATWLICALAMGLLLWAAMVFLNVNGAVLSPWPGIAAVTMMWCAKNQSSTIRFMLVIPVTGRWLALITMILIALAYREAAVLAVLFLVGCWFWTLDRIPFLPFEARAKIEPEEVVRGGIKYDERYYEDVAERERRRRENERLRRLFEGEKADDE